MPGAAAPHSHTHPYPVPPSHDWTPHDPSLVHVFASTAAAAPHVDAPHDDVVATEPAPDDAMPHFTLPAGSEGSGSTGAAAGTAAAGASGAAGGTSTLESEQTVSVRARLVRGVAPHYPSEARDEGLEADVPLEIIVSADGVVESARGLGRADHGFEAAALDAIRGYRFAPASRDGHAVRVRMRWTMEFRLR
jgi:protein TonB